MIFSDYLIEIENIVKIIKKNNYKFVAIQIPEGLKNISNKILDYLNDKTKCNFLVLLDPCYGSCDIPVCNLESLNVDLIVHIGHSDIKCLKNSNIPIVYVNAFSKIDIIKILKKSFSFLEGNNIGIVSTVQFINQIKKIKQLLEQNNFHTFISNGDNRIEYKGQILGCNFSSAKNMLDKIDSILFVGSGYFHPIGLKFITEKPVIAVDPYTNSIKKEELELIKNKILKQRYGAIVLAKKARSFGILVGLKFGQSRIKLAFKLKEMLESSDKKYYFFALNNFSPMYLNYISYIDCFISTSCPRIAIDDYKLYKKPILTPIEMEIVLGIKKWSDYKFDEIVYSEI